MRGAAAHVRVGSLAPLDATTATLADPPINALGIPGMGTGIGRMDSTESAEQMRRAFVEVMNPRTAF